MEYDEVVAHLTIKVQDILSNRGIQANRADVFGWLYNQSVHISDDPNALAENYIQVLWLTRTW